MVDFSKLLFYLCGENGDDGRGVEVVLDLVVQTDERLAHGIVERGIAMGRVLAKVLDRLADGLAVDECAYERLAGDAAEGDEDAKIILKLIGKQ